MTKNDAEFIFNNIYDDCLKHKEWNTKDENNWSAIRFGLEQIANYFELKIERLENDNEKV